MDSDSSLHQQQPPHHHHHHHPQHQPPPQPHHHQNQPMMVGPTNSYPTTTNTNNNSNNTVITNNTTTTTTTTSTTVPPPPPPSSSSVQVMSQQHQIQTQNPNPNLPRFPFNSMVNSSSSAGPIIEYSDGSGSSPRTSGFSIEPARKKRGRPRKYAPDGNVGLGLSPAPVTAMSPAGSGHGDYSGGGTPSSEPPTKRSRGRPPGSGKKQLDALGSGGVAFTPHLIMVNAGEDVASKVMAFAQQGHRSVCILSAHGAISNVTLQQSAISGGTVTYEGRFQIITLSGFFMTSETNGSRNRKGGISVSLAGSDGRVLGGGVRGMLTAASPVQVVMGSFIEDRKKRKSGLPPTAHAPNMLNFSAPVTVASPPSQDGSSNSSDENGGSPIHHGPGPYNNAGQPMQSMQMYSNMGWTNSTSKMHPN